MRRSLLLSLALVGCASSSGHKFDDSSTDAGQVFNSDAALNYGDTGMPNPGGPGCTDAAKLVYLVTAQNDLYSFDPGTLALQKIGTLDCPTGGLVTPNSMAVDRNALAYVNMSDGSLYTVDTSNAHCQSTTYTLGQTGRRIRGMGFSSDVSGGTAETLYTCTADDMTSLGGGLAKITLPSYGLVPIADYTSGLAGSECELTGTGDAKLFGFFAQLAPPKLAEINKTSASTPGPTALSVNTSSSYAFSFWGGDFWFYTAAGLANSEVTRYKYASDKSFSVVVPDTGMTIVGAGVSTCAPLQPPN